MEERARPALSQEIAAAWAWWRGAGVDSCFADEPVDWLAQAPGKGPSAPSDAEVPAPTARTAAPAAKDRDAPASPALSASEWPSDLTAFEAWWLAEPALDNGRVTGRVPPRGPAGAPCMIVVEEPEANDTERLLSGPQGQLLSSMLMAMGLDEAQCRIASVLPRHMPMPDWRALERQGLGALLAHHIAISAPQRLIVLGSNILPLLGNHPTISGNNLPRFNHEGQTIPMFAVRGLAALLERPRWKAGVWHGWLDWMRSDPPGRKT